MRRDDAFRGFETWFNQFKMTLKMYTVLGTVLGVVQLVAFGVAARWALGAVDAHVLWHWAVSRAWCLWDPSHAIRFPFAGEVYPLTASQLAAYLDPHVSRYFGKLLLVFLATCSIYLVVPLVVRMFRRRARTESAPQHVRGADLVDAKTWGRLVRKTGKPGDLPLGTVSLPVDAEPKHVLVIGRPGVGKTVLLGQAIERARARGDRGVIYDFKGDYTARFFDPTTDLLFNPLDTRCVGWNLFNDVVTQMDVDALAASLIPPAFHADPFWNDAARGVFRGILHYLYQSGRPHNPALWETLQSEIRDITRWLKHTKGGERGHTFIQDGSSKQAQSVHSVVMQYAQPFEYLAGVEGGFSVVDWLRGGNEDTGWIFVTNYSDIQDTLRPILSLFVDLLGRKLLALPDDPKRRVFFFLDEFGTLQRLSTIVRLLTLSRSKGGSVWLGVQDVGQIDKIYTKDLRQAIVNACGTSVLFAVSDPDTAKFLSEKIGERERWETEDTFSMGPSEFRDGVSLARRKRRENLILPSELMSLPDLTAYVKIGGFPLTQTQLTYTAYEPKAPALALRDDLLLERFAVSAKPTAKSAAPRPPAPSSTGSEKDSERPFKPDDRDAPVEGLDVSEVPTPSASHEEAREAARARERESDAEAAEQQRRDEELLHDGMDMEKEERDRELDEGGRELAPPGTEFPPPLG